MVMDTQGMTELMQQWQRMVNDAAQSWANVYTKRPEANPLDAYRQMSEAWLRSFSSSVKGAGPIDPAALRKFLDDSLDMWTKTLAEVMGGEASSTAMGQLLSQNLAVQGALRRAMEPYMEETWKTLNLASHKQVLGVAEQLKTIEQRLEDMEDRLEALQESVRAAAPAPKAARAPSRAQRRTA